SSSTWWVALQLLHHHPPMAFLVRKLAGRIRAFTNAIAHSGRARVSNSGRPQRPAATIMGPFRMDGRPKTDQGGEAPAGIPVPLHFRSSGLGVFFLFLF